MKCKKCATLYSSFCHPRASGGLCGFISSLLMISVDGITNLPMVCFFPNKPTELTAKTAESGTSEGENRYSCKCLNDMCLVHLPVVQWSPWSRHGKLCSTRPWLLRGALGGPRVGHGHLSGTWSYLSPVRVQRYHPDFTRQVEVWHSSFLSTVFSAVLPTWSIWRCSCWLGTRVLSNPGQELRIQLNRGVGICSWWRSIAYLNPC